MPYTFQSEQWLPYLPAVVFSFFANPDNLPRLMPRWQRARIERANLVPAPPPPSFPTPLPGIAAGSGTRLLLSFRAFPLSPFRIPWHAEISEFVWNDHFCDIQLRGPFKSWKHCHRIRPEARSTNPVAKPVTGTLLTDHVTYDLPLGPLGTLANLLFVRRQLASTFRYRHRRTLDLLSRSAG